MFLLLFLISFFTFLEGGQFVYELFGYPMRFSYTPEEYNLLNFKLFLSLFSLVVGYGISQNFRFTHKRSTIETSSYDNKRKFTKYSFYFLTIPYMMTLAEGILAVRRGGYIDYYTYNSQLPKVITELSDLFLVSFLAFLATFPTKNEAKRPIVLFLVLAVLSLLTGRRLYFVTYFLLIIGYALIRNNEKETWLSKKTLILIICIAPFIVAFLFAFRYIRYKRAVVATSFMDLFLGFFKQQGYSANLIALEERYEYQLSDFCYSFHFILRFLRINPISKFLFPQAAQIYARDRESLAIYGPSFPNTMSYILLGRQAFLNGYGTGSCYIAELYHDFGYSGIVFGNILYGITLKAISKVRRDNFLKNAVSLMVFVRLLCAPRYSFDYPYILAISISVWLYFAALHFASSAMKKKSTTLARRSLHA